HPRPPRRTPFPYTTLFRSGNWKGAYGAAGYNVIGDLSSYPSYATVTPSGTSNWTWSGSTSDPRALQKADTGATDRIAACWYSGKLGRAHVCTPVTSISRMP